MSLFNEFKKIIKKEQFNPSALGLFVNPFYFVRRGLYKQFNYFSKNITGNVLDVGCGTKPYKHLFNTSSYIGLEIKEEENNLSKDEAIIFYDGKRFPFVDSEFDSVITSQVFEHVFNPGDFIKEINRVLKGGGVLLMSVPFIWDEHAQPFDYGRYTSFGLKSILEKEGFEVLEQKKNVVGFYAVTQIFILYLYKILCTKNGYVNFIVFTIFISPFVILGTIFGKILPKNEDLYMDNIILAKKK